MMPAGHRPGDGSAAGPERLQGCGRWSAEDHDLAAGGV